MNKSANSWGYENHFRSDPDECAKIITQLVEYLEDVKWSERDIFSVRMATEEAIMNAIRHGNAGMIQKKVELRVKVEHDSFWAEVTDEGSGFDPQSVPDPTHHANLSKGSGRGVMLMRRYVKVTYNESGNSVTLEYNRSN